MISKSSFVAKIWLGVNFTCVSQIRLLKRNTGFSNEMNSIHNQEIFPKI